MSRHLSVCGLSLLIYLQFSHLASYGHSGGTDSRGGHRDRIHGGYHFHHGMGPHQHPEGICPYAESSKYSKERGKSKSLICLLVFLVYAGGVVFNYLRDKKAFAKLEVNQRRRKSP